MGAGVRAGRRGEGKRRSPTRSARRATRPASSCWRSGSRSRAGRSVGTARAWLARPGCWRRPPRTAARRSRRGLRTRRRSPTCSPATPTRPSRERSGRSSSRPRSPRRPSSGAATPCWGGPAPRSGRTEASEEALARAREILARIVAGPRGPARTRDASSDGATSRRCSARARARLRRRSAAWRRSRPLRPPSRHPRSSRP